MSNKRFKRGLAEITLSHVIKCHHLQKVLRRQSRLWELGWGAGGLLPPGGGVLTGPVSPGPVSPAGLLGGAGELHKTGGLD